MNKHGILSITGKMAAQMRRGRRVGVTLPYPEDQDPTQTIKLWGFLFYEWNTADPSDFSTATMLGNPFQKGLNWHIWDNYLRAKIAARGGSYATEVIEGSVSGGTFTPGAGGAWILLKGRSNLDLAAALDIAVLGNSAPKEHVAEIKRLSGGRTKVMTGLHNFQSVNQRVSTYTQLEAARLISRGYALSADGTAGCSTNGLNRYSCTAIDEYEGNASGLSGWPRCTGSPSWGANTIACPHDSGRHAGLPANATSFTKHVWECDVTNAAHQTAIAAEWVNYCNTYYGGGYYWSLDGMLVDNMRQDVYTGDSTNASPLPTALGTTAYRQGWRDCMSKWRTAIRSSLKAADPDFFPWVNCTDLTGVYSVADQKNRWVEFFFVNTSGTGPRDWAGANGLQAGIQRAHREGLRIVLGLTDDQSASFANQYFWATTTGGQTPGTHGTWAQIYSEVQTLQAWNNVYAQAVRQTTAGGWCFWQTGWRLPVA